MRVWNIFVSLFIISISYCMKAKVSGFDLSKNSNTQILGVYASSMIPTTPTARYTGSTSFSRLVPGEYFSFQPNFSGTITEYKLEPATLPPGLSFNSTTGEISGIPTLENTSFPLTTYIVTAISATGQGKITLELGVLGSGENVWSVMSGHSNGVNASRNTIKFDPVSNCIYFAGQTFGDMDGQVSPTTVAGTSAGFVSKYDLQGNRIWTRVFGVTNNNTAVTGLALDSSGNIYLSGFAGPGTFHEVTITIGAGYVVGYVIKFDKDGNRQWTNSAAPNVRHTFEGIVIDNNGHAIVSGHVNANTILSFTNNSWTDAGVIVFQFNGSTGAYMTGSIVSGTSNRGLEAYGTGRDTSGNIYVAGATRSSSRCGTGGLYYRPTLLRFNSSLTYLGCTPIPTAGTEHSFAFGITTSPSGDSYLSGYAVGSSQFDGMNKIGNTDGFVTKFNSAGVKQWTKLIGMAGGAAPVNAVEVEPATGKLYFSGMTNSNLGGMTIQGGEDMFVAKYSPDGVEEWIKLQKIQGAANTGDYCSFANPAGCASAVTFDSNSTMYSFGDTNGTIGTQTNPSAPKRAIFLVRNVR